MKKIACVFLAFLLVACGLVSCGKKHQHEWKDATCESPKTCISCGEIEGSELEHVWKNATCESPKTCTRCLEKQGASLGHSVRIGTCPKCGNKSYVLKKESDQLLHYFNGFVNANTDCTNKLIDSYQFSTDKYQRMYVQEAYNKYTGEGMEALGKAFDMCELYPEFSCIRDKILEISMIVYEKSENNTDNSYMAIRDTLYEIIEETLPIIKETMAIFDEWQ